MSQTPWDSTQEGQNVRQAWNNLLDTYQNKVPGHTQQLRNLAQKPIGG